MTAVTPEKHYVTLIFTVTRMPHNKNCRICFCFIDRFVDVCILALYTQSTYTLKHPKNDWALCVYPQNILFCFVYPHQFQPVSLPASKVYANWQITPAVACFYFYFDILLNIELLYAILVLRNENVNECWITFNGSVCMFMTHMTQMNA